MNFFLEPYIFAIDPENTEQITFEKYINSLTEWEEFSKMEWGQIFLLSDTYDCLFKNGFYPFTDKLKTLIQKYNISHIGINDVDRILNQFLIKFPTIEQQIDIPLYEIKNVNTKFDLSSRPDIFNQELFQLAGLISLKNKLNSESEDNNIIFTKDLSGSIEFETEFDFMLDDSVLESEKLIARYSCFESFNSLCSNNTIPKIIWKNANSKKDFDVAIRISIMQDCFYDCLSETYTNHSFYLQDSFINCIDELHFQDIDSKISSTLRALKEVVLNLNPAESHWLRIDAGGSSPQLKHNNYCAWRKDIDYEYHLHYWNKAGEIKFANIFAHNTFTITREL